jgi:alpha-tubulin suppressor-like RCC1 family protein
MNPIVSGGCHALVAGRAARDRVGTRSMLPRAVRGIAGFRTRLTDLALILLACGFVSVAATAGNSGPVRAWYYDMYGYGIAIEDCATVPSGAPCGSMPGVAGDGVPFPLDLGRCKRVAVGGGHFAAITVDGQLRVWGNNNLGQSNVPSFVEEVAEVALGESHTLVLSTDGFVVGWGSNEFGQINVPFNLGACTAIASGAHHSLAIRADGTVRAWGRNDWGQCSVPTDLGSCVQVVAGERHSVALRSDGTIRAWGSNDCGQTGIDGQSFGPGAEVAIGAGFLSSLASAQGYGVNAWGCLPCSPPHDGVAYRQFAAGYWHSLALTRDGRIRGTGWSDWYGCQDIGADRLPAGIGRCVAIAAYALGGGDSWSGRTLLIAIQDDDCNNNGLADDDDIASGRVLDLNANGRPDSCEIDDGVEQDCNNDGRIDSYQLASGEVDDLNQNNQPDTCDLALGWEEDCDGNGVIDSWQQQLNAYISVQSGQLGPIGYTAPQSATYAAPPYAISDLVLQVVVKGDFSSPAEHLSIYLNGRYVARVGGYSYGRLDCSETGMEWTFIPREFFNEVIWSPDGPLNATFEFRPSIAVDADLCPDGSWIQANLEYVAAVTEDCNANGLLDVCERTDFPETDLNGNGILDACEGAGASPFCPGDIDGDREVGSGDIGALLIRFGLSMPGDPADLDQDGEVGSGDISMLLTLFGPC